MTLMSIRLELGRTREMPQGDPSRGYEFVAPLNAQGHLDAEEWRREKKRCAVRSFQPGKADRQGMLRHVGRGWRFDYLPGQSEDDEPFFKLDRHVIAPGLYVTVKDDDVELPFKIVAVQPAPFTS